MEGVDLLRQQLLVGDEGGFRDLDLEQIAGEAGFLHHFRDRADHVVLLEIAAGEVERHRHDGDAQLLPAGEIPQHEAHHVEVDLVHQVVFLQRGDEAHRHQEAVLRVLPAGERLLVADLAGDGAGDGLIVDLQPALLDGLVDVLDDVALQTPSRVQAFGVEADELVCLLVPVFQGDAGVVQQGDGALHPGRGGKPRGTVYRILGPILQKRVAHLPQPLLGLVAVAHQTEVPRRDMADHAVGEGLAQQLCRVGDQSVALGVAEAVVVIAKKDMVGRPVRGLIS